MDRRRFLIHAGQAFTATAGTIYLLGCDDDSGGSPTGSTPTAIVSTSTVNGGHSHRAELPLSDLGSSSDKDLVSSSSGGHTHMVTLSVAQLATLQGGGEVTVTSTTDSGHSHSFTFRG